jgi:hypothetical protein
MLWQCGLTTVPDRRHELLPNTLASLVRAGFPTPHLFVDNLQSHAQAIELNYPALDCAVTYRIPRVGAMNNWWLGFVELYVRNPWADRYAMFEDDLLACLSLREYLDRTTTNDFKGYWNLLTHEFNRTKLKLDLAPVGWLTSDQGGRGAVATVFNNRAATEMIMSRQAIDMIRNPKEARRVIDGALSNIFRKMRWPEHIHNPGLIQHVGFHSTQGHKYGTMQSFLGVDSDALQLLDPKPSAEGLSLHQTVPDEDYRKPPNNRAEIRAWREQLRNKANKPAL